MTIKKNSEKIKIVILLAILTAAFMIAAAPIYGILDESAQKNTSNSRLDLIEQKKQEMTKDGFYTTRIRDYIEQTKNLLNRSEFGEANKTIFLAEETIRQAYKAKEEMIDAEDKIRKAIEDGADIKNASLFLSDSKKEIFIENYEGSLGKTKSAKNMVSDWIWEKYGYLLENISIAKEKANSIGINDAFAESLKKGFLEARNDADINEILNINGKVGEYESALNSVLEINSTITELEKDGVKTILFRDILNDAVQRLTTQDMEMFKDVYLNYKKQHEAYKQSKESLTLINETMGKINISAENFGPKIKMATLEMQKENYLKSEILAKEVILELEAMESKKIIESELGGKRTVLDIIKANIKGIIISLGIIIILALILLNFISKAFANARKNLLLRRIRVFHGMLEDAQRRYFREKKISRESYVFLIDKYQEKIITAREALYLLERKQKR